MYLLDTDTVSNFFRGRLPIVRRMDATPPTALHISTVTVHQLFAGSFDTLNKLYSKKRINSTFTECSESMIRLTHGINTFNLVPFTDKDEEQFALLDSRVKRIGSSDCRISMVALRLGLIVVTCNGKDFSRIPSVLYEDWSR